MTLPRCPVPMACRRHLSRRSGRGGLGSLLRGDQFAPEIKYFSDCILNGREPEPSGEEGMLDVRVIEAVLESARIIEEKFHPDGIDINMGCPVYKITSNFNGAALMKDAKLASEIAEQLCHPVHVSGAVE